MLIQIPARSCHYPLLAYQNLSVRNSTLFVVNWCKFPMGRNKGGPGQTWTEVKAKCMMQAYIYIGICIFNMVIAQNDILPQKKWKIWKWIDDLALTHTSCLQACAVHMGTIRTLTHTQNVLPSSEEDKEISPLTAHPIPEQMLWWRQWKM